MPRLSEQIKPHIDNKIYFKYMQITAIKPSSLFVESVLKKRDPLPPRAHLLYRNDTVVGYTFKERTKYQNSKKLYMHKP